jgi:hypothetical protein
MEGTAMGDGKNMGLPKFAKFRVRPTGESLEGGDTR